MQISYAILTHNETDSLQKLLDFLLKWKDDEDEIVILDDYSDDEKTKEILDVYSSMYEMKYEQRHLHKDFANQKNYLNGMCEGSYIMNMDADELPSKYFMKNIKMVLESNETIDLFWIPRVNTVEGITEEHIQKWGWQVNEKGWVNFPDYQGRLYKKRPNIRWEKPVHEQIVGYREHTFLPSEKEWAIIHKKDIERQEEQNKLYSTIK
ncbi:MAG: glycosyltransferase [Candidatus Pelagibacter sp.]|nr:glycosyltransferase [Candidatus Pelagibacter sp.]